MKIAVIGGDGTGPEVTAEALKVLAAVAEKENFTFETTDFDFGGERYLRTGETLPDGAVDELKKFDAIFLGAVGHPDVAEAAVIGIEHPKWDERPLLVIVKKDGTDPDGADILKFMEGKIAKWWMPDDVAFVDEIPHTATGKISKLQLRQTFEGYTLPTG